MPSVRVTFICNFRPLKDFRLISKQFKVIMRVSVHTCMVSDVTPPIIQTPG